MLLVRSKVVEYAPKTLFNLFVRIWIALLFEPQTTIDSFFDAFNDLIATSAIALTSFDKSVEIPVETPNPFKMYASTFPCSDGLIIPR